MRTHNLSVLLKSVAISYLDITDLNDPKHFIFFETLFIFTNFIKFTIYNTPIFQCLCEDAATRTKWQSTPGGTCWSPKSGTNGLPQHRTWAIQRALVHLRIHTIKKINIARIVNSRLDTAGKEDFEDTLSQLNFYNKYTVWTNYKAQGTVRIWEKVVNDWKFAW